MRSRLARRIVRQRIARRLPRYHSLNPKKRPAVVQTNLRRFPERLAFNGSSIHGCAVSAPEIFDVPNAFLVKNSRVPARHEGVVVTNTAIGAATDIKLVQEERRILTRRVFPANDHGSDAYVAAHDRRHIGELRFNPVLVL